MQEDRTPSSVTVPFQSSIVGLGLALALGLGGCAASNLQMARMAEQHGNYEAMLTYCQNALEATSSPDARLCMADAQRKLGNYQAAEKAYLAYLNDRPGDTAARLTLVELYLANRQNAKARIQINQVLRYDPREAKAYYYRGELERRKGACRPAVTAYRKALELAPGDELARSGLIRAERELCNQRIKPAKKPSRKPVRKSPPIQSQETEEPASAPPARTPASPPPKTTEPTSPPSPVPSPSPTPLPAPAPKAAEPLPPQPSTPPPAPESGGSGPAPAGSRPGPKPDEWLSPTKNPW